MEREYDGVDPNNCRTNEKTPNRNGIAKKGKVRKYLE
jgi:hypothetical protein